MPDVLYTPQRPRQDRIVNTLNDLRAVVNGVGGTILLPDGTVTAPGLAFANDTDCGVYRVGANDYAFSVGGKKIVELSSSSNIHTVGLSGTGSEKLLVQARSGSTSYRVEFALGRASDEMGLGVAAGAGHFVTGTAAGDAGINANAHLFLGAEGSSKNIYLVSTYTKISASLGVGVNPSYPLHVEATADNTWLAQFNQLDSAGTPKGTRVFTANTTATNQAFEVEAGGGVALTVWSDRGVSTGGVASPGATNLAVAGLLYLGSQTTHPLRRYSVTVANGATAQLHPTTAAAYGVFFLRDDADWQAQYCCDGNTQLVAGAAGRWTITAGTATHTNVYYTGGTLTIQNNTGGSRTYTVLAWTS